jgi:hypothetical protein
MTDLNPDKLHVVYKDSVAKNELELPRKYTLTHSDSTGDLFLTIGAEYDYDQISSLYTRFMRDEVLAEWQKKNDYYELHLYMHVSGGFCFGWAGLRDRIFCYHLPLVLQTIKSGDKNLIKAMPELENTHVIVHFQSKSKKYNRIEKHGQIKDIHC